MSGNLLPSATYASPGDALWASRVAPTVVSPVLVKSPDGTKTGTIAQNNNGNMVMYSDPAGDLYLGSAVFMVSKNGAKSASISVLNNGDTVMLQGSGGTLYLGQGGVQFASANQTQNAQLVVANNGDTGLYQSGAGSTLFLGGSSGRVALANLNATPVVQIGTANGTVYDTVYNPTVTYTVLNDNTTGNVTYDQTASRPAGKYQLQLSIENVGAPGASTNFLQMGAFNPPSSALINYSGNEATPGGVGNALNLNSGYFTHPGGDLRVLVNAVTTPWTGTWSLQLVKIG